MSLWYFVYNIVCNKLSIQCKKETIESIKIAFKFWKASEISQNEQSENVLQECRFNITMHQIDSSSIWIYIDLY